MRQLEGPQAWASFGRLSRSPALWGLLLGSGAPGRPPGQSRLPTAPTARSPWLLQPSSLHLQHGNNQGPSPQGHSADDTGPGGKC